MVDFYWVSDFCLWSLSHGKESGRRPLGGKAIQLNTAIRLTGWEGERCYSVIPRHEQEEVGESVKHVKKEISPDHSRVGVGIKPIQAGGTDGGAEL